MKQLLESLGAKIVFDSQTNKMFEFEYQNLQFSVLQLGTDRNSSWSISKYNNESGRFHEILKCPFEGVKTYLNSWK